MSKNSPLKRFRDSNYFVTEDGRIWSECRKQGKFLNPSPIGGKRRYLHVILILNGKRKTMTIHRMVAECYIPNPDNYPVINHKDGNTRNNSVSNLEWCTNSHNTNHAYNTGLAKGPVGRTDTKGSKNGRATVTESQVKEMRRLYKEHNIGYRKLAKQYKMPESTVYFIISNKTWKEVK